MADDSEDDLFFVKRALESSGVGEFFRGVEDGQQAVEYLQGKGKFADREKYPFPNVLLIDIKMPRMNGFDVLKWLEAHPQCKVIPTIIFSSSKQDQDVHQAYVLGVNAYIEKPSSASELVEVIQLMYKFWAHCETPLPPPGEKPDPISPSFTSSSST